MLESVATKPAEAFHLGGFVHAVASVLMPLDPDYAAALARELREGPFRDDLQNEYKVPASEAAAWAAARDGNARCVEFCRAGLHRAADDGQLMNQAITAQAEGAGAMLRSLCEEWSSSSLARERCLAVSLLPWLLDEDAADRLAAMERDDPSG